MRMSKETTTAVAPAPSAEPVVPVEKPKTLTNWSAFDKARLIPKNITCDGYQELPGYKVNLGCHSKLTLKAESILSHIDREHGGSFWIKVAKTDGPNWPGWKTLSESGIEISHIICEVCNKEIPLVAQHFLNHMKVHGDANKQRRQSDIFKITLSSNRPITNDESEDAEY